MRLKCMSLSMLTCRCTACVVSNYVVLSGLQFSLDHCARAIQDDHFTISHLIPS